MPPNYGSEEIHHGKTLEHVPKRHGAEYTPNKPSFSKEGVRRTSWICDRSMGVKKEKANTPLHMYNGVFLLVGHITVIRLPKRLLYSVY